MQICIYEIRDFSLNFSSTSAQAADSFIARKGSGVISKNVLEGRGRRLLRNLPSSFSFRAENIQPYPWLGISANGKRGAFRKRILRYECLREKGKLEKWRSAPRLIRNRQCDSDARAVQHQRTCREANLLEKGSKRAPQESALSVA